MRASGAPIDLVHHIHQCAKTARHKAAARIVENMAWEGRCPVIEQQDNLAALKSVSCDIMR